MHGEQPSFGASITIPQTVLGSSIIVVMKSLSELPRTKESTQKIPSSTVSSSVEWSDPTINLLSDLRENFKKGPRSVLRPS